MKNGREKRELKTELESGLASLKLAISNLNSSECNLDKVEGFALSAVDSLVEALSNIDANRMEMRLIDGLVNISRKREKKRIRKPQFTLVT